jgi:formiminotetrahydrofolate cyclodeaminase
MGYLDEPLKTYSDALASGNPTPGGGSAAALVGALGAALNSMVANFTVGREKFAAVDAQVRSLLAESERLRTDLERLTQADTEAYAQVSAAYKMPRDTDDEKAARQEAIQKALKAAAQVPMQAVRACHRVLQIANELLTAGNPNLITDVGVSARFALAALECAVLNAEINLIHIKDKAFVEASFDSMKPLLAEGEQLGKDVWHAVIHNVREGVNKK